MMKKLSLVIVTAALLAACGTGTVENEQIVNGATGGDTSTEEVVEESTEVEETVAEPVGLEAYMPSEGLVKNFEVDSFELTRKVLELKKNKVLEEITFGDVKTVQVTQWSEDNMKMLYNTGATEGITDISIDGLIPTSEPEVMIDAANSTEGEWIVTNMEETLETPAETFENVIVIEQTFKSESSDQVTTLTHYYAPEIGFVKEKTVITNGESEEVSEVNLVSYK